MTPCEYVMWRYRGGSDKEMVKKDANTMTKEEMEALRKKAKEEKVQHGTHTTLDNIYPSYKTAIFVFLFMLKSFSIQIPLSRQISHPLPLCPCFVRVFFQGAIVEELVGRRTGKREHEYEIVWEGQGKENSWATRTELIEMGYQKMVNQKDEQIAMESMLGQRKLTTGEIQKHFDGFGLEPQFAQHTRMGALSGREMIITSNSHPFNHLKLSTHL